MERLIGMPNIEQNLIKMLERPEIQVFLDNGLYNEALVGIMNLCDAVDMDKLKSQMQEVLYSYWLDKWNNVILKNKTDDIEGFYD